MSEALDEMDIDEEIDIDSLLEEDFDDILEEVNTEDNPDFK